MLNINIVKYSELIILPANFTQFHNIVISYIYILYLLSGQNGKNIQRVLLSKSSPFGLLYSTL